MIAALLLALGARFTPPIQTPPPPPNNVLVVIADDVGWPEWSSMPALQTLAAQGVTLDRAYSACPVCTPSRFAMLFGRYGRSFGIGGLHMNPFLQTDDRLDVDLPSLADELVATHHTLLDGKWHLGRANLFGVADCQTLGPSVQGFERWENGIPATINTGTANAGYYNWREVLDGALFVSSVYATDRQRDGFLQWWATTSGPKFAVLSWAAAHSNLAHDWDTPPGMTTGATPRERYLQTVSYMDSQLCAILSQVNLADTFIVWVGDNGTPDNARPPGYPSGTVKGSTFEGGIRVPLVFAGPGIYQGVTTSRLVSLLDLGATLAGLLDMAPLPRGFEDSRSFVGSLGPGFGFGDFARDWVFSEWYDVATSADYPQPAGYDDQAIIEKESSYGGFQLRMKLRRVDADGVGPNPSVDLVYNLLTDPYEIHPADPSVVPTPIMTRLYAELASLPPRVP